MWETYLRTIIRIYLILSHASFLNFSKGKAMTNEQVSQETFSSLENNNFQGPVWTFNKCLVGHIWQRSLKKKADLKKKKSVNEKTWKALLNIIIEMIK